MAPMLSQATIEDIRAHNDIVDTIGSYLPLKRAGSNFRALCPFHKEKTPSFNVNQQRQIYHCFGCHAGGDVFKFVQEYEGVDFITSAKILARRASLSITFDEGDGQRDSGDKELLYRVHEDLARMFHRVLLESPKAERARAYLAERDVDEETLAEFQLGYAPDQPGALRTWVEKKKYGVEQLEAAGILVKYEGRSTPYERFRDRLMFPIHDELGRVIGFSGRLIEAVEKAAKYVNSPETILFKKSRVLYALNKARRSIVEARKAVICEGQLDVIRCHHAGLTSAVAPQGTALTEDHARILKRYAEEVVLVFDADKAGREAAVRSGILCMGAELSVLIASLPPGQDPDTLIRQEGLEAFQRYIDEAKPLIDFQVDLLSAQEDLNSETGSRRAVRALEETIGAAASAVQQERLISQVSRRLAVPEDALRRQIGQRSRRRPATSIAEPQNKQRVEHPQEEVSLAELLVHNEEFIPFVRDHLPLELLVDPDCRLILGAIFEREEVGDDLMSALADASEEGQRLAASILSAPHKAPSDMFKPGDDIRDHLLRIWRNHLQQRKRNLRRQAAEASGETQQRLEMECSHLTMDIERVRQGWESAQGILVFHADEKAGPA